MEPSQIFGVSEECHSSESGWTMYIGSPANDDSSSDEDEEHKEYYYGANYKHNNDDSDDDSMASDASSGPSHQKGNDPFKVMKKNDSNAEMNFCLQTKTKKPLMERKKKQRDERKEVKVGQKPRSSVQSTSKVRKNILMSKID